MSRKLNQEEIEVLKQHISYCPETGHCFWIKRSGPTSAAGDKIIGKCSRGYVRFMLRRRVYLVHRVAFLFMGEEVPEEVDHLNGDKSDNRWINIRACTRSQNTSNQGIRRDNRYGVKGLLFDAKTGKWYGQVAVNRKFYRTPKLRSKTIVVYCLRELQRHLFGDFYRNS